MNVLDMTIIRLAAGLVLLIAANIALGSINAIIAETGTGRSSATAASRARSWLRR